MVNFELLFKLAQDGEMGTSFEDIIMCLEMQGIEMSESVRELGVALGVLIK